MNFVGKNEGERGIGICTESDVMGGIMPPTDALYGCEFLLA